MLPDHVHVEAPAYDAVAAIGIGGITIVVAIFMPLILARGDRARALRWFAAILGLMGLSALAAYTGVLTRFDVFPPPMLIMIVTILAGSLGLGLSPMGRDLAAHTPLLALVGLQSFRLPLELAMHRAAEQGIMPVQLSYSGYNYDIVTGIGAAAFCMAGLSGLPLRRGLVWAWNVWGIGCLAAIFVIALATSPMIRAFGDDTDQLNTWVLFMPYVWLPVVLVSTAIFSHVLITRRLLLDRHS